MLNLIHRAVRQLTGSRVRVDEIVSGPCCTLRSAGLSEMGVPEVEISDCPLYLKDVASSLVIRVACNGLDAPESIADGKTIGSRFVSSSQPLIESFQLVRSGADSAVLRIVDRDDPTGKFPRRLVATHLCVAAGDSRRDAIRLLLVSIEVWPMEASASNAALGDYEFNPNNFWSWIDLGTAFSEADRSDDAIAKWRTAVCMWPRGGKLYAQRMVNRKSPKAFRAASARAIHDFWLTVSNETIKNWCDELAIHLPEAALLD